MTTLTEHVGAVGRRVPPVAIVVGVVVAVCAWWLAVQMRGDAESRTPAWLADEGPSQMVTAGPWANWAAAVPPGINSCCNGRSVGATVRVYAPSLMDSEASIIGEF